MPGFRLRWAEQSIEVKASVVIGRGEGCEVLLDDPKASRRHATVSAQDGCLWLEDLGSRNGISVNGQRVDKRQRLLEGDVIRVGAQEIRVMAPGAKERVDDTAPPEPTKRFDAFGVIGQLAEKALALGHADEAERLLSGPMELLLREASSGLMPSQLIFDKATGLAVQLLLGTGRGGWLTWLVQLYTLVRKPWPTAVVDQLYEAGRSCSGYNRQGLRDYCELLRNVQAQLGPAERFQVSRIEGLERVLSAF